MASKSHRCAAPLAGFLLAVSLSGCAVSQTVDSALLSVVYNHAPPAAFKVPLSWNQVSGPALARELQEETGGSGGASTGAFEPGPGPRAADFLVVVHCTTACYGKYRTEIEYSMASVSAVSLVPAPPMWAGLVGR